MLSQGNRAMQHVFPTPNDSSIVICCSLRKVKAVIWFIANRLSLNLKKTCYSIFGPKQRVRSGYHLYIDGQQVQKNTMLQIFRRNN